MSFSAPMRVWMAGEVLVLGAVSLAAGLGLAARPSGGAAIGPPLAVLAIGLVGFLLPAVLALRVAGALGRRAFWLGSCVPAALWLPVLPYVLLRTGTAIASPGGLVVTGGSLLGAIFLVTGAVVAASEVPQAGR